jgi:hypothetical protein
MAFTYEVDKKKAVTIYNDGTIFSKQEDDPAVEGYDAFESKARAEEWAIAAIAVYESEIQAAKDAHDAAEAAIAAEKARVEAEQAEVDAAKAAAEAAAEAPQE